MCRNDVQTQTETQRPALKFAACRREVERRERVVTIGSPVPSEVHVEHTFAVETVANPSVTAAATTRIARDVEWKAMAKLVLNDFGEMSVALVCLGHDGRIIIEIVAQGFGCRRALRATAARCILHVDGDAGIVHQQSHSIFLLCRGPLPAIIVEHVAPIIMRLAEVGFALRMLIIHRVAIFAASLCGPTMEIHDLCHRRSHTSREITCFFIIRIALPPFRFQQRSHNASAGRSGGFCSPNEAPTLFQMRVNLPIGLQQIARFGVEPRRVHLPRRAIGQHFAHGIVARHHNEAVPTRIIHYIIR